MNSGELVTSYRARWVHPVCAPPLAYGVVTVDQQSGQILAIGEAAVGERIIDLGNVALLPAFVNAHTHLEFSNLELPLGEPGTTFPSWIRRVIDYRRNLVASNQDVAKARKSSVHQGRLESTRLGVAAVGEISTAPPTEQEFIGQSDTVFLELLGMAPERQESLLAAAREHLNALESVIPSLLGSQDKQSLTAGSPLLGLSPHAPYTVRPELVQAAAQLSREFAAPLAMHLAESQEEMELLQSHAGELAQLLRELNAWHAEAIPRGLAPRQYLEWLAEAHCALVIHGNFLEPNDWQFLAERRERMTLVHCPRTHEFFQRGEFPLAEVLEAGVRVAVGTDSRASNPDLSVFAELQTLYQEHREVPPEEILKLGTLYAAEALDRQATHGSLQVGRQALLAAVPLADTDNLWESLFRTNQVPRMLECTSK